MAKLYPKKDNNGMYVAPDAVSENTFDVCTELDRAHLILQRELFNLARASAAGKLSAPEARDLCAYIKLLQELKKNSEDDLAGLTDEELLHLGKK